MHLNVCSNPKDDSVNENFMNKYWNSISQKFACDKCPKSYEKKHTLSCHLTWHKKSEHLNSQNKLYKCDLCDRTFFKKRFIESHLKMHASGLINKMNDEPKLYRNPTTKLFECIDCDKKFVLRQQLTVHLKHHDKGQGYPKTQKMLETDKLKQYWNQTTCRYECDQCDKYHILQKLMILHLKSHEEPNSKIVQTSKQHNLHNRPSPGDPLESYWNSSRFEFQCDQCEKSFKKRNELVHHLKFHALVNMQYNPGALNNHWNDDTDRFECDQCTETFEKRKDIRAHLRTHAPSENNTKHDTETDLTTTDPELKSLWNAMLKIFKCNQCDESFVRISGIRHHLRGHARNCRDKESFGDQHDNNETMKYMHLSKYWNHNLSRYECDQCNKTYISRKPMASHLLAHEKGEIHEDTERPHDNNMGNSENECSDSDDSSYIESNYDINEAHESNFSINCPDCDHDFDDVSDFQQHMDTIHSTQQSFECEVCTMAFSTRDLLTGHMMDIHKSSSIEVGFRREITTEGTITSTPKTVYVQEEDFLRQQFALSVEQDNDDSE